MNKTELINAIAKKADLKKAASKKAVESFVETVTEELKKGEKVALVGFGTFGVTKRSARKGRNPQKPTEIINIPAKNVVKFMVGRELKESVNN